LLNKMDFSAPHISFVIASYAVTFAVLGGLMAWTFVRARAVSRRLDTLERDGLVRRKPGEPAAVPAAATATRNSR
jgi:heme exporter protein CcmD